MRQLWYSMAMLGALGLTTASLQAQGVLFVEKETRNGQSVNSQIQMDKDHIRVESRASGSESAFVFDGTKQVARTIDISRKTYMEMSKKDLEQTRKQMDSAMAEMQQQLKAVPAAQRAMIEQMMRGRGGMPGMPQAAPKVEYRQTGSDKVGQWTCTKYEGSVGGQKTSEVCTVDPKEFGLTPADFEVARQLGEFIKTMMPQAADNAFVNGTQLEQGFSGVPVRRTSFRNGAVEYVTEITEVRRTTFPASTFDPPAGFRKEAMPSMQR